MTVFYRALLLGLLSLLLTACTSGGDPSPQDVRIIFFAETDTERVNCSQTLTGLGSENINASLRDLRFFVHDIVLFDIGGTRYPYTPRSNDFQSRNAVLMDFTNLSGDCQLSAKPDHTEITGTVSSHEGVVYTSIEFKLGVPAELNHNDPATASAPLNNTEMHRDRTQGYVYARLSLAPESGGTWTFELASTGCSGDPELGESVSCERSNRPVVRLNNLDIERDNIVLNIATLLATIDLEGDANGGCDASPSDPECSELFDKLALNASGNPINNSSPEVFSVD